MRTRIAKYHRWLASLVLVAGLIATSLAAEPAPSASGRNVTVRPDRPRIFLRPDGLAAWRARFQEVPSLRDAYAATRRTIMGLTAPSENGYISSTELENMALIYMAENRAAEPLAKARRWMEYFSSGERGNHWSWPLITESMSVAFDWFYADLSATERQRYGQTIVKYAQKTLGYADHDGITNQSPWSNQTSDYFNQFYWHQGRVPFAGIALAGEAAFAGNSAKYLAQGDEWLHRHMLPATNQAGEGGGWFESLGYNNMTATPFALLLEAWRTGTGEDLFPQSTWLPGNPAWVLYSVIPHSGQYVPMDDITPGPGVGPSAGKDAVGSYTPLLALRYRDLYAQYFAKTLFPAQYPMFNFAYLLWYDPDIPSLDLDATVSARWFKGLGQVNMRTGWGKQDTMAVYRAGRVYGGHGHNATGEFLIYRKGNLLVEDGYYGFHAPELHNTLYVGGEMRKPERGAFQHFIPEMDGTTFDYGRITGVYGRAAPAATAYDWIDSDLSRGYTAQQASVVSRSFVFLHPRTFLVIDHTVSLTAVEKRFRLQAPAVPHIDQAQKLASWQQGEGKLYVRTLLPANAVLQSSAGKTCQLYSVSPTQPAADEVMLHVLYAADLDEAAPAATLEKADGFLGARVQTPGELCVVWFRTDGKSARTLGYTAAGNGPVRHLIANLEPGTYRVTGPGAPALPLVVKANEPLAFETTGGGAFTVTAQ